MTETLEHGYSSESHPLNTNMTGFGDFQESLPPYALDESSLSIERVKKLYDIKCMCYGVLTLEVSGQGEDLLSIVQDIHALGVGVVTHSERARNTSSKNTETSDKNSQSTTRK